MNTPFSVPAPYDIFITCPPGLYPYLQKEVRSLGLPVLWAGNTGAETRSDLRELIRLNFMLRTGHRVLVRIKKFPCNNPQVLYEQTAAFPWHEIIGPGGRVSVTSTVLADSIRDTRFANLKVKDAIVDRISAETGSRPDSGPGRSGTVVHLHWKKDLASLYIDTSGEPLTRRGYRKTTGGAPMQESLAAAVVMETGWDEGVPFVNPMCGTGTLAIEAALMGAGRAPGLLRSNFGFLHLLKFDRRIFESVRAELKAAARAAPAVRITASDSSERAVAAARRNAAAAGVDRLIDFHCCDFAATPLPSAPFIMVMNPPYGMRMGGAVQTAQLYERIGAFLVKKCPGRECFIFSGDWNLVKRIPLKPARTAAFSNARIKCHLHLFRP
jgi:23S rRNA G2445 N2-methylase RlmL